MQILKGHTASVFSVAFSPDGTLLASASGDETVCLWDLATGSVIRRWPAFYPVSVAFSPDGQLVASASVNVVQLWDVATGTAMTVAGDLRQASRPKVRFSPDGSLLAVAGTHVDCVDVATRQLLPARDNDGYVSDCVAFSPDGTLIASGYEHFQTNLYEHAVVIRDAATWTIRRHIPKCRQSVTALAFAPDNCTLAACSGPRLWVWDSNTGRELAMHRPSLLHFQSVAFSPYGELLASASNDQTARFWDTATWQERRAFTWNIGRVRDVQFASDGLRCAACGSKGKIVIWDVDA